MDVDVDNFEQALAELERHLPQAAYIAVDLEMTGIIGTKDTQVSGTDLPQEQYSKARKVIGRPFNIVQVGFCLFEEKEPGQFECRPFNVFVFPRQVKEQGANGQEVKSNDSFLGLSSATAVFLHGNGFDFNRWIGKGVNYTSVEVESKLLEALSKLTADAAKSNDSSSVDGKGKVKPDRPEDIKLVEDVMRQVAEFEAEGGREMKLPWCNKFLALCLRQRISADHPGLTIEKRQAQNNPRQEERWVVNDSSEGRKQKLAETRQRFMSHIGFRRMWNLLKACHKPVVFHNGFFDLCFLFSAFEGTLPASLADFKALVRKSFPLLYDTKILAESKDLSGRLCSRSNLPELSAGLDGILKLAAETREAESASCNASLAAESTADLVSEAEAASCNASTAAESTAGEDGRTMLETADAKAVVDDTASKAEVEKPLLEERAELQRKKEAAIAKDDFEAAASLRDMMLQVDAKLAKVKQHQEEVILVSEDALAKPQKKVAPEDVSFMMPTGFDKYAAESDPAEQSSFHTAGYDAYQTGRIFTYYRAVVGDLRMHDFVNRIFLMFSHFELTFDQVEDQLSTDGIARFVSKIDNKFLNNRTFLQALQPVLEKGKRRAIMKWSSDYRSMMLVLHGHTDTAKGTAGREACEKCLDGLLRSQADQGRLEFATLEEHMKVSSSATKDGERYDERKRSHDEDGKQQGKQDLPEAKRQRVE